MADKIDVISNQFVSSMGIANESFKARLPRSSKLSDIKEYLKSVRDELKLAPWTNAKIKIEEKHDSQGSCFHVLTDRYIEDYDPFGQIEGRESKKEVFLKVEWSLSSSNSALPAHGTGEFEQTSAPHSASLDDFSIPSSNDDSLEILEPQPDFGDLLKGLSSDNSANQEPVPPAAPPSQPQSKGSKRKQAPSNEHSSRRGTVIPKPKQYLPPKQFTDVYDPAAVPLLPPFDANKMLKFKTNIKRCKRSRYISDIQRVRQQISGPQSTNQPSPTGKACKLVPIQGVKPEGANKFTRVLPELEIPKAYFREVQKQNGCAILCAASVKEFQIDDNHVGYCVVGNRQFVLDANTPNQRQNPYAPQVLTQQNVIEDCHKLHLYTVQTPNELDNIVGPALFKIAKQAGQDPQIGFTFGDGIDSYRLAIFGLKENDAKDGFVPDFASLTLSDYFDEDTEQPTTA